MNTEIYSCTYYIAAHYSIQSLTQIRFIWFSAIKMGDFLCYHFNHIDKDVQQYNHLSKYLHNM